MSKNQTTRNVYAMVLCAVLISLSAVLSEIKLMPMPMGGSITLFSMLAATLCGYFCGPGWGFTAGVSLGLINLILDPIMLFPLQIVLDYFLAFGSLGLSGLFNKMKHGLYVGYTVAIAGRFICSFLSGALFFAEYAGEMNPWIYSFLYNMFYIGGEGALTLIILTLPPVKSALTRMKNQF